MLDLVDPSWFLVRMVKCCIGVKLNIKGVRIIQCFGWSRLEENGTNYT